MKKPTERFTSTVEAYSKYRPGYPSQVLSTLIKACNLNADSVVADVGSGTGKLTKLLLDYGGIVYAVEPNDKMRQEAERSLQSYENFISVKGTAEATTLQNQSIDIITVGTAFHWFNADKTKEEFKRVLKPGGWVFLVWNMRDMHSSLIQAYEKLLTTYASDYCQSAAEKFDKSVTESFFVPNAMYTQSFDNSQRFNWEGLQGRLLSTSYCLAPTDPDFPKMMTELKKIFEQYQCEGYVDFVHQAKIYYGQLL